MNKNLIIRRISIVVLISITFSFAGFSKNSEFINLAGKWGVQLDPENRGFDDSKKENSVIQLPGSLAENRLGVVTEGADSGMLTPTSKYIGKAWYWKEIVIPEKWGNREISLFLERVLWESKVFIDGKEYDTQDALGTPHVHKLGELSPGKHLLAISVSNELIHEIGLKGHSYTDHTQTFWNGIVGRIELVAKNRINIKKADLYADVENDKVKIKLNIPYLAGEKTKVVCEFFEPNKKKNVLLHEERIIPNNSSADYQFFVPLHGQIKKWDEFTPNVYQLKTSLVVDEIVVDVQTIDFGLREVSHDGTKMLVNGNPTFLRGNLDNAVFPLTGYPSCKVKDWERIFRVYKDYGLNHVRFHSWCPPEAAFIAADKLGIYIQAEAGVWLDGWMPNSIGVGKLPERDAFIRAEIERVIDTYGNHPSFVMFCIGNELGNADFNVLEKWIKEEKEADPRRLYAASTARTITSVCDYSATHSVKGIGMVRGTIKPTTDWDYEARYQPNKIPIIAHEIGQWPVYPGWDEIKKYKGVLKARNLEQFRELSRKNGIEDQSRDFQLASGALNQLLYKYEIESFLRTPSCAGIQLLGINDYPGQGEALIGWLDSFYETKNITSPEKFRCHCNTTVPLLRFEKYVWSNNEKFKAKAEISHFDVKDIENANIDYAITTTSGEILHQGVFKNKNIKNGTVTPLGEIEFSLSSLSKAEKLKIELLIKDTAFRNEWYFWSYPAVSPKIDGDQNVLVASRYDKSVINALEQGKKVLLNASLLGSNKTSVKANFYPLYWSLTYFSGQGKPNIGLLVNNNHPCFRYFPTDFHSDWQWESISEKAKGFIVNELPKEYKPILQPVNDFHSNNKVGSIMEFQIGKGKLLICGYDFQNDTLPVARQLEYSLLSYMESDLFKPTTTVKEGWLRNLLGVTPNQINLKLPQKYKNALIYIKPSGNIKTTEVSKWEKSNDISLLPERSDYRVMGVTQNSNGWTGDKIMLDIHCPKGILGTLYINVKGLKSTNLALDFEGREENQTILKGDAKLLKFHIMREDSQDEILKVILKGVDFEVNELAIVRDK